MTSCEAVGLISREGPAPPSRGSSGAGGSLPMGLGAPGESVGRVWLDPACWVNTFSTLNSPPKSQALPAPMTSLDTCSWIQGPDLASPFLSACGQTW